MKDAMVKYLYNKTENRFARMGTKNGCDYELDMTIDARLYGLFSFCVFAVSYARTRAYPSPPEL